MASQPTNLESIIDALDDHSVYHPELPDQLEAVLNSLLPESNASIPQEQGLMRRLSLQDSADQLQSTTSDQQVAAMDTKHGAQIRRLVNKSLTTLSAWSKKSKQADSLIPANSATNHEPQDYRIVGVCAEVGFIAIRALERIERQLDLKALDIEKARSNLISKMIELGMKKQAMNELLYMRDRLLQNADATWGSSNGDSMMSREQHAAQSGDTRLDPESVRGLQQTYAPLFSFALPTCGTEMLDSSDNSIALRRGYVLLVLAMQLNAIRCWMDTREGKLSHLLHDMLNREGSPYDWCQILSKLDSQLAQLQMDSVYRLLFMASIKVIDSSVANDRVNAHAQAFEVRMLGLKYYSGCADSLVGGSLWEKALRCGTSFESVLAKNPDSCLESHILRAYKDLYLFCKENTSLGVSQATFKVWLDHFIHLAEKTGDWAHQNFAKAIGGIDQRPSEHELGSTLASNAIQESIEALKSFEAAIQDSANIGKSLDALTLKSAATVQDTFQKLQSVTAPILDSDIAIFSRISKLFMCLNMLRSIGLRALEAAEVQTLRRPETTGTPKKSLLTRVLTKDRSFEDLPESIRLLNAIQTVVEPLVTMASDVWRLFGSGYSANQSRNSGSMPSVSKLSAVQVDAILFLFRLQTSEKVALTGSKQDPLSLLNVAHSRAIVMADTESLQWISNAFYNYGGSLFKTGQHHQALDPLTTAVCLLNDWISAKAKLGSIHKGGGKADGEALLTLSNRYEVLGACYSSVRQHASAIKAFESGMAVLPAIELHKFPTFIPGDATSRQSALGKLLTRRTRSLFLDLCRFDSVTQAPQFLKQVKHSPSTVEQGAILEYELSVLQGLSVKSNSSKEQIQIMRSLLSKVYQASDTRSVLFPIRRARVLVALAVVYQSSANEDDRAQTPRLIQEAVDILKSEDLQQDSALGYFRNDYRALAFTWSGILGRRDHALNKDKPFRFALQLWEGILSEVECFTSWEVASTHTSCLRGQQARQYLFDPQQLYNHFQLLADYLGVIDQKVLQIHVYLLMLRMNNGLLPLTQDSCSDSVRIYARIGQAYLGLGYSGKAKVAMGQGKEILEEMARLTDGRSLEGDVYATWLLAHSVYLSSMGATTQGAMAYNQAKCHSTQRPSTASRQSNLAISKTADYKVRNNLVLAEASLARSRLLFNEGHLAQAINDAQRAIRQLSSVISVLTKVYEVADESEQNPFMTAPAKMSVPTGDQSQAQPQGDARLQRSLELLAVQRNQWPVFKLLMEAFHLLSQLHLTQGGAREAEYFLVQGRDIASKSHAPRSTARFDIELANLHLRRHDWSQCENLLKRLLGQEQGVSLSFDVQDVYTKLCKGDFYVATSTAENALVAYGEAQQIIGSLMDRSFIASLETSVAKRTRVIGSTERMQLADSDDSQFECVTLSGIRASMGYRCGLLESQLGRRAKALELIDEARISDRVQLAAPEYHLVMAKVLMLELESMLSEHLMFNMVSGSVLTVGLFQKVLSTSEIARVTRLTRVNRNQQQTLSHLTDTNVYLKVLLDAREHLRLAYVLSIKSCAPHIVSDICARQAQLSILESCFQTVGNDAISARATSCHLEMAKAIAQRREMHSVIKSKLYPSSPQDDRVWPNDLEIEKCSRKSTQIQAPASMLSTDQCSTLRFDSEGQRSQSRALLEKLDRSYDEDVNCSPDVFLANHVDILPEKWTVVSLSMDIDQNILYVNRLRAGTSPLVVRLPLSRFQTRDNDAEILTYTAAKAELDDILQTSNSTLRSGRSSMSRQEKKDWWDLRERLDDRLFVLLGAIQSQWLRGFQGLVQSHYTPTAVENLTKFQKSLQEIMALAAGDDAVKPGSAVLKIDLEMCRMVTHLGDQPDDSDLEDLVYFFLDAYQYHGIHVDFGEIKFMEVFGQIRRALAIYWNSETAAGGDGFDQGAHIILILDKHLQMFPWESIPVLRGEAVSRLPSICFLRDRILQQMQAVSKQLDTSAARSHFPEHNDNFPPSPSLRVERTSAWSRTNSGAAVSASESNRGVEEADYRINQGLATLAKDYVAKDEWEDLELDPKRTFYVLNPSGDLQNTEDVFEPYVTAQDGWDGIIGRAPFDRECISGLTNSDLYIYFGHSGGEQYIRSSQIRQLPTCAVSLLFGCSSGHLKTSGEFDPTGNVLNFILAGCPTVVANLWDVTDRDIDRFSKSVFCEWGLDPDNKLAQALGREPLNPPQPQDVSMEGLEDSQSRKVVTPTDRVSISEASRKARDSCKLKYLVGAAPVVYGIPCFLKSE